MPAQPPKPPAPAAPPPRPGTPERGLTGLPIGGRTPKPSPAPPATGAPRAPQRAGGHLSAPPPPGHRAAHPPSPKAVREQAAQQARSGHRTTETPTTQAGPTTGARSTQRPGPPLARMGEPLPTLQPVDMAAPAEAAPRSRNWLLRHWRGELPLAMALIASGALVWLAVQGLDAAQRAITLTEHPAASSALWLIEVALLVVGALWWGVGVARAAIEHANAGGSMPVALLAGATGLGAFAWVGMFWWQSARHVAPDVWAIVNGTLKPAQVQVEAGGASATLDGDLEFGSMRALRAALDANPAVKRVKLESRGGRVSEGLALGRLIAARNLDTLVTGECSSACVTAFAGGRARLITPKARIGLHSAGGAGAGAQGVAQANRVSDEFIASRGVDLRVLDKGAAVANDSIWFPEPYVLLASGLATDYAPR